MTSRLTKYEKETVLLYNQSQDPITISTYDPGLRRRLREFAARYPDLCRRVDKQKYPDYAEYEIQKDRVSIRLLPPMSEEKRKVASEKAKAAGLGTRTTPDGPSKQRASTDSHSRCLFLCWPAKESMRKEEPQ